MYLQPHHRIAVLLHGGILGNKGKTGLALLRYSENPIVAVIDEDCAGQKISELTGIQHSVPVVPSVEAALAYKPDVLAIGLAPSGGRLPEPWMAEVRLAIASGLSIMNGLHTPLQQDPDCARLVSKDSQWLWDMRQEPPGLTVGTGQARNLSCRRILAVGTDMAVGKMSACIELTRAAKALGQRAQLIATGQTALMLGAPGIALDAVRVDFAAGAVEHAVMAQADSHDLLFVEGQGSLLNPASTATLPLLRGSQPTHLVLVHRLNLTRIQHFPDFQLPPIEEIIHLYETVAAAGGTFAAPLIAGIALNTYGFEEREARDAIANLAERTKLPCTDVVRFGATPILEAILRS